MKKIFLFLLISFTVFSSCSGDENATTSSNGRIQRIVVKDENDNVIVTESYEYQSDKLSRIVHSSGNYTKVYYTNDFITRMESFRDNALTSTGTYQYNASGKLSGVIIYSGNNGYRTSYIYNDDNTVSVTEYTGDLSSQTTVFKTHKVFLENGVAVKRETYGTGEQSGLTFTREYTYDNKNNPTYAILGYARVTLYEIGSVVTPNNITQISYSQSDSSETSITTASYTYNSGNLPISRIETNDGALLKTTEYFY